jgi:hypothetical protein
MHGSSLLAMRRTQAIGAGIATPQNNNALACRKDFFCAVQPIPSAALVLLGQVVHCEVDALQLAARYRYIAVSFGSHCEQHRVVIAHEFVSRYGRSDVNVGPELDSFGAQLIESAVDHPFFEFKIGNAVAQQAADPVLFFYDCDLVAGAIQLLCRGHTRRT